MSQYGSNSTTHESGRWPMSVSYKETKKQSENKSNDYFESMQYRQDLFAISHYHKRNHFPSYTCYTENHNNTCAENRKIRDLKFDTLY